MNGNEDVKRIVKALIKCAKAGKDAEFLREFDAFLCALVQIVLSFFGLKAATRDEQSDGQFPRGNGRERAAKLLSGVTIRRSSAAVFGAGRSPSAYALRAFSC